MVFGPLMRWTSLEPLLRGLGVTELAVCGVVTNLCVETTVRSAFIRTPALLAGTCCAARPGLHGLPRG